MRTSVHRLRLIFGLAAVVAMMLIATACAQDETVPAPAVVAQPTAMAVPAIDTAALSSMVQQAVEGAVTQAVEQVSAASASDMTAAVNKAIGELPTGVSAADMEAAIKTASAGAPTGVTAAQMEAALTSAVATQPRPVSAGEIQRMVEAAVAAAAAPGATKADVKVLVDAAVKAASAQAATKEELGDLVSKAVAAEVTKGPSVVTADQVAKIVSAALEEGAAAEAAGIPVGIQVGTSLAIAAEIANFYTLNPLLSDQSVGMKMTNVLDSLITFDRVTSAPRPLLAKSWTVSDDGKLYTFNLRDDVFWTDGVKFTSADVKFTVDAALLPTTKFKYYDMWQKIVDVQTPDDYTVKFILDAPFTPLLNSLDTVGIIAKHLNEEYLDNLLEAPYSWMPVGTGAYIITEHSDELLTFKANPDYWGEKARIETIYWRDSPPGATARALLETGSVDLTGFHPDSMTELLKTGKYRVIRPKATSNTAVMHINNLDPLFQDKRVRQALYYAFDREAAIKAYAAPAMLMHSPISAGMWAYNDKIKIYDYDPEKALALLAEVGWTKNADGKLVNSQGEPFKFTITHVPWGGLKESGVVAHQNWNDLGMEVELKMTADWSTWVTNVREQKKFQVGMMGHGMGVDPGNLLPNHYKCGATYNLEGWCNAEVDQLLIDLNTVSDPAARKESFDRFQEIFVDELPRLPVMHRLWEYILDAKLKGPFLPVVPSAYFKMNEWYWEK
jgi:peptide/nickel transport system substrate-binding protein